MEHPAYRISTSSGEYGCLLRLCAAAESVTSSDAGYLRCPLLRRPDLPENPERERYEFFMWWVQLVQDGSPRVAQRTKCEPIGEGRHRARL